MTELEYVGKVADVLIEKINKAAEKEVTEFGFYNVVIAVWINDQGAPKVAHNWGSEIHHEPEDYIVMSHDEYSAADESCVSSDEATEGLDADDIEELTDAEIDELKEEVFDGLPMEDKLERCGWYDYSDSNGRSLGDGVVNFLIENIERLRIAALKKLLEDEE